MTDPKIISLQELFGLPDPETEVFDIPEWGGAFVIRELSRAEVDDLRSAFKDQASIGEFETRLLLAGIVEPALDLTSLAALRRKRRSVVIVERLVNAISRLSGMGEEAAADAKRSFPS